MAISQIKHRFVFNVISLVKLVRILVFQLLVLFAIQLQIGHYKIILVLALKATSITDITQVANRACTHALHVDFETIFVYPAHQSDITMKKSMKTAMV